VFHFIEALAAAGVNAGLPDDLALLLAKQTVFGAAKLACDSEEEPSTLRQQVTSPNGTTAAALSVLMSADAGLGSLVNAAVHAARRRSIELGT
jgi:pyrroline-5-carboxylate reductase